MQCTRRTANEAPASLPLREAPAYIGEMNKTQPWYKDGLRFTCTQCGNCCTGDPGVVWVTQEEVRRIAEVTGRTEAEVRLLHTRRFGSRVSLTERGNGDCTFFDSRTRRCTIYEARPAQCRTWPFWKSNLRSPHAWSEVQKNCPGAGRGSFFDLDEIERQAAQIEI